MKAMKSKYEVTGVATVEGQIQKAACSFFVSRRIHCENAMIPEAPQLLFLTKLDFNANLEIAFDLSQNLSIPSQHVLHLKSLADPSPVPLKNVGL